MKPYKLIRKARPMRRVRLVDRLPPPRIPLWFVAAVHTPPKPEVTGAGAGPRPD